MSKWQDVKKGDAVELGGRTWTVVKAKPKGKVVKVTVERKGHEATSEVRAKDAVTIKRSAPANVFANLAKGKREPVQDADGAQTRWATDAELKKTLGQAIPAGDETVTEPPEKAHAGLWDTPVGALERKLDRILGAVLVGESKDEAAGYYVPPVDVSTVAAHLALMHGGIPAAADNEAVMLRVHAAQHAEAASRSMRLAVNHWHTEKRP